MTVDKVEHLLRDLLREEASRQVSIDSIQKAVAEHFDIRLADMTSRRRPASIAFPRQVAMYLSRTLTKGSLMEIGEAFGGRDHGTVIHACKKVERRRSTAEPGLKETAGAASRRNSGVDSQASGGILHRSSQKACQGASESGNCSPSNHPGYPSMKFRISKEAFLDGLQKVQHVVSSRTTLPILSNVLLVAKDGRIQFTTTDLDVGITGSVEAQIEKEGATTLPAKRLVSIVRELPASEVEVSVDAKNVASIRSGPSFFKIIGLGEAEFPPLPDFAGRQGIQDPAGHAARRPEEDLLRDFHRRDPLRAQRHLHLVPRRQDDAWWPPTAAAWRWSMPTLNSPPRHETDVIIPTKAVQELQRLLGDDGEVDRQAQRQPDFLRDR